MKSKLFPTIVALSLAFANTAYAGTILDLETAIVGLLKSVAPMLIAFAIVFLLYAILRYLFFAKSDQDLEQSRAIIVYGIISVVVIVSLWGIVSVIAGMLDLNNTETVNDVKDIIMAP